jgi:hypothetical protein
VRTLSDLSRGESTDDGNEPAYWELGDGAVLLHRGTLHVLNASARALWVAISNGADEESAVNTIADQWHTEPEAIRVACLHALPRLRAVAAGGLA